MTSDPIEAAGGHALSPAESAIAAAGVTPTARELPQLSRLVARRLPADRAAVVAALCEVRRKSWANRLLDRAYRGGAVWVGRNDTRQAAARIDDPDASDATLQSALDAVLAERFRALPSAEAALDQAANDVAETGTPLNADQYRTLAGLAAAAHGLDTPTTLRFLDTAIGQEDQRRTERDAIRQDSRARRRDEVAKLRAWERSLIPAESLPGLLHCGRKEAERWIEAGLIPVARRVNRRGGEKLEFDPAVVIALRRKLPEWRSTAPRPSPAPASPALLQGRAANEAVARVAALDRYAAHFTTARALQRRITLVTGPTNSGKSYLALNRLAAAESGLALAPLRLLAHEFREALADRGVAASLSTGEERMPVPGSRHLAATVEMCPMHRPVAVAMVDEAQMLHDPDRGAAWTAAIMGAPASDVIVLGAPDCIDAVRRIATLCADPIEEIGLERKGVLRVADKTVRLRDLRAGDALIAFSRREVLDLRAALAQHGRRVAVVYGALSPEVRRAEAARFNSGEAEILVATDAIGMGLNLHIRRIVFAALQKYDGRESRQLTPQEVKQIGGRAGRYGKHEEGIITALEGAGLTATIAALLHAPPRPPADRRLLVQPDADIVRAVGTEIGSDSLFGILARIRRGVLRPDDPNYRLAGMESSFAVASAIEGIRGLSLPDRWTYAMCPVNERDGGVARLAAWAADHAAGRPVRPLHAGRLPAPERAGHEELERAEKTHRRLVAWRWLALRFPDIYADRAQADGETARLNDWIEAVLRSQRKERAI